MSNIFYIKQNDVYPPLQAYLQNITLDPTHNIKFTMTVKNDRNNVIINEGNVDILDINTNLVEYNWETTDTAIAGQFQGEFIVYVDQVTTIRVPNNGYFNICIDHSLGDTE